MRKLALSLPLAAVGVAAFLIGTAVGGMPAAAAQDRGPTRPKTGDGTTKPPENAPPMVFESDAGRVATGANGIIAVTGSYGVGTSVLYVIDTNKNQLAVYEARGGSPSAARLFLVGARRIDLDLQLEGYNDLSEYDYREMRKLYDDRGVRKDDTDPAVSPIPISRRR